MSEISNFHTRGCSDENEVCGRRDSTPQRSGGREDFLTDMQNPKSTREVKLLNDLTECFESFHDINLNIKVMFLMFSPHDRFIPCVSYSRLYLTFKRQRSG